MHITAFEPNTECKEDFLDCVSSKRLRRSREVQYAGTQFDEFYVAGPSRSLKERKSSSNKKCQKSVSIIL